MGHYTRILFECKGCDPEAVNQIKAYQKAEAELNLTHPHLFLDVNEENLPELVHPFWTTSRSSWLVNSINKPIVANFDTLLNRDDTTETYQGCLVVGPNHFIIISKLKNYACTIEAFFDWLLQYITPETHVKGEVASEDEDWFENVEKYRGRSGMGWVDDSPLPEDARIITYERIVEKAKYYKKHI